MIGDLTRASAALALRGATFGRPLDFHEELPSTNDSALAALAAGVPHGALVVADSQTHGRGRRGRVWHSPSGVGLYFSIVVRGEEAIATGPLVAAVGLGVSEGLQQHTGLPLEVKWPNDVWIAGRKVAGILVEARGGSGPPTACVVGIGVNVRHAERDFPPDVRDVATSLALHGVTDVDRAALLRSLLDALAPRVEQALGGRAAELETPYRDRSALLGVEIELRDGDRPLRGVVADLSPSEGLLLRAPDGTHVHVRAEHARDVRRVAR